MTGGEGKESTDEKMIDGRAIEHHLDVMRYDMGLLGGAVKVKTTRKAAQRFSAEISLKNFYVSIKLDEQLDEIWAEDEALNKYAMQINAEPVPSLIDSAFLHEVMHWKRDFEQIGCPTDLESNLEIADGVFRALENKKVCSKYLDERTLEMCGQFTNAFTDIIVNTKLGLMKKADGLPVFYYDNGASIGGYSPLTEAFMRIQMELWGEPHHKGLIERFYATDSAISKRVVEACVSGLDALGVYKKDAAYAGRVFSKKDEWPEMAYRLTSSLAGLLDLGKGPSEHANQQKNPKGEGKNKDNAEGTSSAGKSDKDKESNEKSPGKEGSDGSSGDQDKKQEASSGKKEKDGQNQEQEKPGAGSGKVDEQKKGNEPGDLFPVIVKSMDAKAVQGEEEDVCFSRYSAGKPRISIITPQKSLAAIYKRLAPKIPIKASSKEKGFEFPIAPAVVEPYDPEKHAVSDIDFSNPVFDPESQNKRRINFTAPTIHYTKNRPYTEGSERLPDLLFLIDCSGTMGGGAYPIEDACWGLESRYHFALLGLFGALKWVKSERIAPYIKYNVTAFSDSTRSSGWQDYSHMDKALSVIWSPEFGGTSIDMSVLGKELRQNKSVIIMLSDGQIHNWNSIKEDFRTLTTRHELSFIEIQSQTEAGQNMKSWGRPVFQVEDIHGLDSLIIDLTKKSYKGAL